MAYAAKAFWEEVEHETLGERSDTQSKESLFVFVLGIAIAEGNCVVPEFPQAVIGDSNSVGVGAEVFEYLSGTAEGFFRIDSPGGFASALEEFCKFFGI